MKYIRRTNKQIVDNFAEELLKDRGIIPKENNQEFLTKFYSPTIDNEYSPELFDNIEQGYQLLKKHIENKSKIYLCIDPDVDGFTSAALFYLYVKNHIDQDCNIVYHVPEGKEHGLSTLMGLFPEDIKSCDLIVLPDSSSNDYKEHEILKAAGYDILVLDHHEAEKYSENAVVINNQLSQSYPNKSLSGVGIVYKFFEYWQLKEKTERFTNNYIDLVALGQISDMMNMMTLENRFICDYGLNHINSVLFTELVTKQSFSLGGKLNQIGVAFYITPLINALIRLGSSFEKERLFEAFIDPEKEVDSTKRGEKGLKETVVTQCVRKCSTLKERQNKEKEKAIELLDIQILNNCLNDNKILILNADDLNVPTTLTGLIAMGIAAKYKKPTLLGRTSSDGYLKGSLRGREESELKDFKGFLQGSHLMDYTEGHSNAAGFGIKCSDINKLYDYANQKLKNIDFNEGFYEADFIVEGNCSYLSNLIEDLCHDDYLYGQGNPEPIIVIEDITLEPSQLQVIGKNSDTLKFVYNGITYIKFKATELIQNLKQYSNKISLNVAGKANINIWNGNYYPQILLEEIEIKEMSKYDF